MSPIWLLAHSVVSSVHSDDVMSVHYRNMIILVLSANVTPIICRRFEPYHQVIFTDLADSQPESVPLSRVVFAVVVFAVESVLFAPAISIDSADRLLHNLCYCY
jgi:hypothetical protein